MSEEVTLDFIGLVLVYLIQYGSFQLSSRSLIVPAYAISLVKAPFDLLTLKVFVWGSHMTRTHPQQSLTMSHPAASVKSIYSGRTNFSQDYSDEDMESASPRSDNSITSRNLRAFNVTAFPTKPSDTTSSTNASIASENSDYQLVSKDLLTSPSNASLLTLNSEVPDQSRPPSRISTTSCLSTTATKDGIEGKRLHRDGPTPYSTNVIANMVQSHQQSLAEKYGDKAGSRIRLPPRPASPFADSDLDSSVSGYTTSAVVNGGGSALLAPITLKEKMHLLETIDKTLK